MGSRSPGHDDSLHPLKQVSVDQRLMGLEVDQLAEVNLPEVEPVAEHGLDAMEGAVDSVAGEEGADLSDRCPLFPTAECLPDCGYFIRCARLQPGYTPDIPHRDTRPRHHSTGNRIGLSGGGTLLGHPPLELIQHPERGPLEPLGCGCSGDLTDVDRDDLALSSLDAGDDLLLDAQGANEAVQVGDHEDVSAAGLNGLDGGTKPLALGERCAAGNVEFLMDIDESQSVALTSVLDASTLLSGAYKRGPLAPSDARDTHDPHGPVPHLPTLL